MHLLYICREVSIATIGMRLAERSSDMPRALLGTTCTSPPAIAASRRSAGVALSASRNVLAPTVGDLPKLPEISVYALVVRMSSAGPAAHPRVHVSICYLSDPRRRPLPRAQ